MAKLSAKNKAISDKKRQDRSGMSQKLKEYGWPFGARSGDGVILWEYRGQEAKGQAPGFIGIPNAGLSGQLVSRDKDSGVDQIVIYARIFVHGDKFVVDVVSDGVKLLEAYYGRGGVFQSGFICGKKIAEDALIGLFLDYTQVMGGPILADADDQDGEDNDDQIDMDNYGMFSSDHELFGVDVSMAFETD